ncbi:MAG: S9 family peptidase [Acidobacteriota bacterium]|nr:S9 family peptidase [Acidobacteriota bacterium]
MSTESKAATAIFTSGTSGNGVAVPAAPVARREPVEAILHDDRRVDHYAWLRNKESDEVIEYLKAENAYTDAILRPTEALQEKLYQEMLGRILQTDLSVPYRLRGYRYFSRTEEGKQYAVRCRQQDVEGSPEEVLLDLNALAEGHSFLGLGSFEVSDDNELLAYSTDTTGYRQYTLQVKNLASGENFGERFERVTSVAWAADNRTLFFTEEDDTTKRSYRLYRHVLGSDEAPMLLYEERDERFRIGVERTRTGNFLLLTCASHTASEVSFLSAKYPAGKFLLIEAREENHEYYVEHHHEGAAIAAGSTSDTDGGAFFIRTNSGGRTFRLMEVFVKDPARRLWREVIPNRPDVMLSGVHAFANHLVLDEREGGLPYLRVVGLQSRQRNVEEREANYLEDSHRIEFTEPAYNAAPGANPEFVTDKVRFQYESFVTPRSVFDYDVRTRARVLLKQQPVLGEYEPRRYVSERLHATAADGTRIPISLVYRRDAFAHEPRWPEESTGGAPLLLYGYGSYGISVPVTFSSHRLSLLDRGVIFAIAHIRGGGELGKPWHDGGRMREKMNTFTDFISVAEFLITKRYTSPGKLVIEGGSAGGLLMGAVTNLRPYLFHAVITHVPFVDVLNTMLDASLPLTVGEFEEWGNPQIAEDYWVMKSYCPYTNVTRRAYPAMLVKTGLNDSQVMYWEPAKYVAKMRAKKTDNNCLLFKVNMGAGHGGASGRYDYLREIALDYAFLLTQSGIRE